MSELITLLAQAGSQYGYSKSRRHPSVTSFIYLTKARGDIIDLDQTVQQIEVAREFIKGLAIAGKKILFVGTKPEARSAIVSSASSVNLPYIENRWIGGTLTNFTEIRRRLDRLMDLQYKREHNELVFKTKKERLMLEREIEKLEKNFGGITSLTSMPSALIVVDPQHEDIAVTEARQLNIPVIALANTDCDISMINYPIVANDSNISSISSIIKSLTQAYSEAKA